MVNKILMSVDMDEWYQCRWATGSEYAIWPDTQTFFREYYGTDEPIGEIIPLTEKILHLFDENSITATFFFTGEIADYYPDLVKEIANCGHEIASHNYVHKDYNGENPEEFYRNLRESKKILEKLSRQEIIGYRAPNSTVNGYMIQDLIKLGFKYDSSVTPTRPIMGKFGKFQNAPKNPYELSKTDFSKPGDSGPGNFHTATPYFKLLHLDNRVLLSLYYCSVDHALKTAIQYIFHPYEIGPKPTVSNLDLKTKLFLRTRSVFQTLVRLIKRYSGRISHGHDLKEILEREVLTGAVAMKLFIGINHPAMFTFSRT